jgi:hypothetical protein
MAGGDIWEDRTLDEWPEGDFRIFCGDIGNEVAPRRDITAASCAAWPTAACIGRPADPPTRLCLCQPTFIQPDH